MNAAALPMPYPRVGRYGKPCTHNAQRARNATRLIEGERRSLSLLRDKYHQFSGGETKHNATRHLCTIHVHNGTRPASEAIEECTRIVHVL